MLAGTFPSFLSKSWILVPRLKSDSSAFCGLQLGKQSPNTSFRVLPFLLSTFLTPSTTSSWLLLWAIWGWEQPSMSSSAAGNPPEAGLPEQCWVEGVVGKVAANWEQHALFLLLLLLSLQWTKRPLMYKPGRQNDHFPKSLHCKYKYSA